ncbi:putative DNA topoisomerase (ATP-hydrolyzing) [Rosa chinensis]|uniref:Putative DNA topoisomerase (ATP-hydrolyzing) n=1 Tax=Rosa chinensis TaxID=74649 RepID=A0A2P6S420_ROSCH|nr:DNA topoisomerase 6 subunit A3 [Rosa chinensis]PRQ53430.1 putative DNA topoisomerase (ATP-hydrolyzing) [Rosa chinensis]
MLVSGTPIEELFVRSKEYDVQQILCEDVEYVEFVLTDVKKPKFILVVENDIVFQRLAESKLQDHFQCIIMIGCGQPSIAVRIFLKKMAKALDILVLVLTDSNPHGLEIFFTYLYGSRSMIYNSRHLRTRGIKWLDVSPQDLIDLKSDEI